MRLKYVNVLEEYIKQSLVPIKISKRVNVIIKMDNPFSEKDKEFGFRNTECEVKIVRFEFQKRVKVNNGLALLVGRLFTN